MAGARGTRVESPDGGTAVGRVLIQAPVEVAEQMLGRAIRSQTGLRLVELRDRRAIIANVTAFPSRMMRIEATLEVVDERTTRIEVRGRSVYTGGFIGGLGYRMTRVRNLLAGLVTERTDGR